MTDEPSAPAEPVINGGVGHDRGNVTLAFGSNVFACAPDIARNVAKALRKAADEADDYRKRLRVAEQSAVPIRQTTNGAAIIHAVPKADA